MPRWFSCETCAWKVRASRYVINQIRHSLLHLLQPVTTIHTPCIQSATELPSCRHLLFWNLAPHSCSKPFELDTYAMDLQTVFAAKKNGTDGGQSVSKSCRSISWSAQLTSYQSSGPSSLNNIAAAFVPTFMTAAIFTAAFVLIRHRFPRIYYPRTYIGIVPKKDRTPCQNRSYWDWIHTMRVVPDKFMLYHQSLDSYLFLRFLRTLIFICVVGACITWPILMPVNATGGGKSKELNRISIGNVKKKKHLYAHATVAWVFFSFVMFTILRERLWLIGLRQAWFLSKTNAKRLSSRTVLYLSAPTAALDQGNMQRTFGDDAVRVWPATKAEKLQSLVSARNSKVEELESAEMSLIQNAADRGRKRQSKNSRRDVTYDSFSDGIRKSLRPTHRLETSPVGKQVDSIDYYREQIRKKDEEIEKARESNESVASHGGAAAVFVEFRTQAAAQTAIKEVIKGDALSFTPRHTAVMPNEVLWENLTVVPASRVSQQGFAVALVIATIILWSIPVSFVGAVSNIGYLAENVKWLGFLNRLPESAISLISGLLPPVLLSMLASYVPKIFRCK